MKRFFLIPLLTLLCSVMAWGTTITVGVNGTYPATDAGLNSAIAAASAGDVIELTSDIAYATNGTGLINITKSITLDGKGHKLGGWGTANISVSGTQNWPVTLAVNYGGEASAALDVTIQNLHVSNKVPSIKGKTTRSYGLMAWDGVDKLTLKNDSIYLGQSTASYRQVICITGTDATPLNLKIEDSYIGTSARSGYPAYILKPINATLKNSEFNGYCGLYFKYRMTSAYGNVVGTRGSVINADACAFICPNQHTSPSNNFAVFPLEDDGITFNLNNCSFNASTLGDTYQRFLNLQYLTRESGFQPVNVKLTGDNTHLYNVTANTVVFNGFSVGQYDPSINEGTCARVDVAINFTIEAGTFTFNPSNVHWYTLSDNKTAVFVAKNSSSNVSYEDQSEGSGAITIDLTKYQINEVKQGSKTLYRVVPRTTTLYDLNSDVQDEGNGQNPTTSFDLSTGEEMTLNQATTKAGYVEVKDNGSSAATVVKVGKVVAETKVNQTLVVNNGLDVQGDSKVEVQAGSALIIGEGGIVTSKPENIIIQADKDGAASLLLDPTITVNQTPELTVRMTAKQIGRNGEGDFYWHRFALPVAANFVSWEKEGNLVPADPNYTVKYPTYLYAWDYTNNDWANIAPNQMVPLQGYTLTLASDYIRVEGGKVVSEDTKNGNLTDRQDVVYTFKGNLVGNTDQPLNFQREGFNFFGNSYTGYMHVKTMLQGLVDEHIDGTAYMWNGDEQAYYGVSLHKLISGRGLENWQEEVAPMQTFILRLRGANSADEEVKYAASIWGNPRYGHSATSAPHRAVAAISEDTYMEIAVKAANGKASRVDFTESANTSDAFESGYDVEKYMNEKTINLYATVNGMNLSSVVTDNIEGKTLSLKTNGEIAYTMSFKNVEGAEYAIRDNATGAVIAIEEGTTYEFAAQPNSTVEGRFEIVAAAKIPTSIDNTEVKANVKGIYTIMGQYLGENFDILPAGVYVVDGVKIVK